MCDFPFLNDNYGLLVANQRDKSGKSQIEFHCFTDGNELINQGYIIDTPTPGEATSIFFSQKKDIAFVFHENEQTIDLFKWEFGKKLIFMNNISLVNSVVNVNVFKTKLPKVHRVYFLFKGVFLLYFRNEGFKLIDTEAFVKSYIWKNYYGFDFSLGNKTAQDSKDQLSSPLILVKYVMSCFEKPVKIIAVLLLGYLSFGWNCL